MTFAWARTGLWLHSSCAECGLTYTGDERDLLRWQRGHAAATCVQRRAETARAASPEGQAAARKWAGYDLRDERAEQAEKSTASSCVSLLMNTDSGVSREKMEASETAPSVTSKPPLDTPSRRSIHMQNRSASATPSQNSGGVA